MNQNQKYVEETLITLRAVIGDVHSNIQDLEGCEAAIIESPQCEKLLDEFDAFMRAAVELLRKLNTKVETIRTKTIDGNFTTAKQD